MFWAYSPGCQAPGTAEIERFHQLAPRAFRDRRLEYTISDRETPTRRSSFHLPCLGRNSLSRRRGKGERPTAAHSEPGIETAARPTN